MPDQPAAREGITLQVSVTPSDLRHAVETLPHQLRAWGGQVQEVLLTLDLRSGGEQSLAGVRRLLDDVCRLHPAARVEEVDHSAESVAALGDRYFGGARLPPTDCRGTPIVAYFAGLSAARFDHVLHTDSDMMFGGGSGTWAREAVDLLETRPEVLLCGPLAGPPTANGEIPGHVIERYIARWEGPQLAREPHPSLAFRFHHAGSRVFFTDRRRLQRHPLSLVPADWRMRLAARTVGRSPYRPVEESLTAAMRRDGLIRIDFLGEGPGIWCVHPPYRSEEFYVALPTLIRRIEVGDVPDEQRGDYDIGDSMVDWSSAMAELERQWPRGRVDYWQRIARGAALTLLPGRRRESGP